MKRSFFSRFFTAFIIVILAALGVTLFLNLLFIDEFYDQHLQEEMDKHCRILLYNVKESLVKNDMDGMHAYLDEMSRSLSMRITLVKKEGSVLFDSDENWMEMENHKHRSEISSALSGAPYSSKRYSETLRINMMYFAVPVSVDGRIEAVLRLSLPMRSIDRFMARIKFRIFWVALAGIFGALVVSIRISQGISKPIQRVIQTSAEIAQGNFHVRLQKHENPEVQELYQNFNMMTSELDHLFRQVNMQKQELHAIFTFMQEGLCVLKSRKVFHYNQSFQKMVDVQKLDHKFFWEVFTDENLVSFVKKCYAGKVRQRKEIRINGVYYLVGASFLNHDELMLLFYDIDEIKKLEIIKRDFIANLSHELRTPLTAIRGFAETLEEDESDDQRKRYLQIIMRHSKRLISMVNDILSLSRLEYGDSSLNLETFDLYENLSQLQCVFDQPLKDKELVLKLDMPSPCLFYGDCFKIEQLLINLIDNAIKYSTAGEIFVRAEMAGEVLRIRVQDNGIGIPPDSLPRVFERFYVVDKSRSRQMGGTGLGLSIVKHIVNLHQGVVEVQSSKKGTCFTIDLPIISPEL